MSKRVFSHGISLAMILGIASGICAVEVTVPIEATTPTVGSPSGSDAAWTTRFSFTDGESIGLELQSIALAPGDSILVATPDFREVEVISAENLAGDSYRTRIMTGDEVVVELLSDSATIQSSFAVTGLVLDFESTSSPGWARAKAEAFYQQVRRSAPKSTGGPVKDPAAKIIYGNDDRVDTYTVTDPAIRALADASCAILPRGSLTASGSNWSIATTPWTSQGGTLCSDEPFRGQPEAPFCSGFLVAPDLIVTAGHCIENATDCTNSAILFGFAMQSATVGPVNPAPQNKVYFCSEVIAQQLAGDFDHALIRLDRPVEEITPLRIRREGEIAINTPVLVIGQPSGLPQKVAGGAVVKNVFAGEPFFQANLDTYGGNSGSPVFNTLTREVEGILVRGATDYRTRSGSTCIESNRVSDSTGSGGDPQFEEVSKINILKDLIPPLTNPTGRISLDRELYSTSGSAIITLLDSNLEGAGTHLVDLSYPGGNTAISLTEQSVPGTFSATIDLAPLALNEGDVITVTYQDADTGDGPATVTDSATIDATLPRLASLRQSSIMATNAVLSLETNEPARVTVLVSEAACGPATITVDSNTLTQSSRLRLTPLQASRDYHYKIQVTDEAGNVGIYPADGSCFVLRTRQSPEHLATIEPGGSTALANRGILFTPAETAAGYTFQTFAPNGALPVDPSLGTAITFGDDAFHTETVASGRTFQFYGLPYGQIHVVSNGYITLGSTSTEYSGTSANHFANAKIALHFTDLDPSAGGTIRVGQDAEKLWVTYNAVRYYGSTNTVTAQAELFLDGRIRITTLGATPGGSTAFGLSPGFGVPAGFTNTVFTTGPAVPETVAQLPIDPTGTGWSLYALPDFDAPQVLISDDSISIRSSSTNSVGLLERSRIDVVSDPAFLMRARYLVSTSITDGGDAPSFRLRMSPQEFGVAWVNHITSVGTGTLSPGQAPVEYTQIFRAGAEVSQLRCNLDLIAVDPSDAAVATLNLHRQIIDRVPMPTFPAPTQITLNASSDWSPITLEPTYAAAILTKTANGLVIQTSTQQSPDRTSVGFFTSPPIPGLTLVENRLYRFDFTVLGSAAAGSEGTYPAVRFRLNDETQMLSSMLVIDGINESNRLPSAGQSATYSVYLEAPAGSTGRTVSLSFDYYWAAGSGKDATLPLTLQAVGHTSVARPW